MSESVKEQKKALRRQMMQQRADDLEQHGVKVLNWRSNGQRLIKIWFEPPQSDDSDDQDAVHESVVPVGNDSPETVMSDVSETVDTVGVEVHPDTAAEQSENSDDRVHDGDAVGTADGSDEMAGWMKSGTRSVLRSRTKTEGVNETVTPWI